MFWMVVHHPLLRLEAPGAIGLSGHPEPAFYSKLPYFNTLGSLVALLLLPVFPSRGLKLLYHLSSRCGCDAHCF